jgi:hypothetical protein
MLRANADGLRALKILAIERDMTSRRREV